MQAGFNYPVRLLIGREPTGSRIKDKKVSLINSVSKIKKNNRTKVKCGN